METLAGLLGSALDLLLVLFAFGSIVFVHELGHFVAARWAGIHVTAFAIGWGPPIISWRRGVGLRRGSSAREAAEKARAANDADAVGMTEYRLSWFPLGGYVKMVGQDDLDPNATSAQPGGWQHAPPWKRMVVISAGVVMNLITAAALFVLVFTIGLRTQPPIIGGVVPGSPAAMAVAVNATSLGLDERGLRPGDRVLRVNGGNAEEFTQLMVEAAMSKRDEPVRLEVVRDGLDEVLRFEIVPKRGRTTGLLELGVAPALSNRIDTDDAADRPLLAEQLERLGYGDIDPGSAIVAVNGDPTPDGGAIKRALNANLGQRLTLTIQSPDGDQASIDVRPTARLLTDYLPDSNGKRVRVVQHLFGLTPVMRVHPSSVGDRAPLGGLEASDIFLRLGEVDFPALHEGIPEIQRATGQAIPLTVLRASGSPELDSAQSIPQIELRPDVDSEGRIGFLPDTTESVWGVVALPPSVLENPITGEVVAPAATSLIERPGAWIVAVDDRPVRTLSEVAVQLRAALAEAIESGSDGTVWITLRNPEAWLAGDDASERVSWTIPAESVARLRDLGGTTTLYELLALDEITLKGEGPLGALAHGFRRTKQVMAQTYLTINRLFHGTVRVEHLRGPVGIAHLGTQIADRGLVWILFFTALVSVNLAVINFLPLPIVDGGQFLFLLYEQIRGKAPPPIIQEISVAVGVLLIATLFIIVTFNDIVGLFGG
ncbi:MAG: site-2 protease family protein [Planctomycetota bacterium]